MYVCCICLFLLFNCCCCCCIRELGIFSKEAVLSSYGDAPKLSADDDKSLRITFSNGNPINVHHLFCHNGHTLLLLLMYDI